MNNSDIILVYHGLRRLFLTGERVRRQQKFLEKNLRKHSVKLNGSDHMRRNRRKSMLIMI